WSAAGIVPAAGVLCAARIEEPALVLPPPGEGEDIIADYSSLGLSLGRHPLALLRPRLSRLGLLPAAAVQARAHGSRACAAGLVTCRQRPDTASGVIFVTLEDETGCVNVVLWRDLIERQHRELLGARLLAVAGTIERDGEVVHLIARRLIDHSALLGRLLAPSRDFH
ncbi:MAG: OB-fold nucleic acid binding domain-containing protein, partial [Burkholderiales bacterium]